MLGRAAYDGIRGVFCALLHTLCRLKSGGSQGLFGSFTLGAKHGSRGGLRASFSEHKGQVWVWSIYTKMVVETMVEREENWMEYLPF